MENNLNQIAAGRSENPSLLVPPKIEVRISSSMLKLMEPALVQIAYRCREAEENARRQPSYLPSPWAPPEVFGAWDFRLGKRTLEFWKRMYPFIRGTGRYRLQLDFVEISICQFAARSFPRFVARKRVTPRRDWRVVLPKFLKEFERYRKRAARETVRVLGQAEYKVLRNSWASFASWLGTAALGRQQRYPWDRKPPGWRKVLLDHLEVIGLTEMGKEGYKPKNRKEFRSWIRMFKRGVRRGREGSLSIRDLGKENNPVVRTALVFFLRRKIQEKEQHRLISEGSDPAENFR
jgi:hypothetical protein